MDEFDLNWKNYVLLESLPFEDEKIARHFWDLQQEKIDELIKVVKYYADEKNWKAQKGKLGISSKLAKDVIHKIKS